MTMTFWFLDDFAGSTAELWQQVGPLPVCVASQTITGSGVVFATPAFSPFALRVIDSGGTRLRSGLREPLPAETGTDDQTFTTYYFIERPEPIVLSPSELQSMLDGAADTDEDDDGPVVIETINLVVHSGQLMASGTGSHKATGLPISFTYLFRLRPRQHAWRQDSLMRVDTLGLFVQSNIGGPLGWLTNWLLTALLGLFQGRFVEDVEDVTQARIDASVQEALGEASVPAGIGITVESVDMHPVTGVTVTASAAVPLAVGCAGLVASGSVRRRPAPQVEAMRSLRDRVLTGTPLGDAYVAAFERHNEELLRLLLADQTLLASVDRVLEQVLRELGRSPARARISRDTVAQVQGVFRHAARAASPELQVVLNSLVPEVARFAEVPVAEGLTLRRR